MSAAADNITADGPAGVELTAFSPIARRCLPELLTLCDIDFDWSKP